MTFLLNARLFRTRISFKRQTCSCQFQSSFSGTLYANKVRAMFFLQKSHCEIVRSSSLHQVNTCENLLEVHARTTVMDICE